MPQVDEKPKSHETTIQRLGVVIGTVNTVKDLVPNDAAKAVLSAISFILVTVQNTIQNKDDFIEVINQCHEIGLVIWKATSGTPEGDISPSLNSALEQLKESVDRIKDAITEKAESGFKSRAMSSTMDKQRITAWKQELDRFLQLFNTHLNISANLKLDELIAMFEERNLNTETQATDYNLPPSTPRFFVGRDSLVADITATLMSSKHTALLGPGGIGKSSIAKAVLNKDDISKKFSRHRYFVRYDDMSPSTVTFDTFLDRIARALGVKVSKADRQAAVFKSLASAGNDVLLVLDNAETFLDATHDLKRITDILEELADMGSVIIMLTTRTARIPLKACTTHRIPGLEKDAARQAFTSVYNTDISPEIVDKLLSALDFHPLSITLLAQASVQNEWSPTDLVSAWEREHSLVLERGGTGFGITVELSLKSPSIEKLGKDARTFLHVVTLLPQGISSERLEAIFPSVSNIHNIVDTMCLHSLMYRQGKFITMLAPIRLYVASYYQANMLRETSFDSHVRTYYRDLITETEIEWDSIKLSGEGGKWIIEEDVNVEHLVALDLATPGKSDVSRVTCFTFLTILQQHKPRPVSLEAAILAMPEYDSRPINLLCVSIPWPWFTRELRVLKTFCIFTLATLHIHVGAPLTAARLLKNAIPRFLENKALSLAVTCMSSLGDVHVSLGQFVEAEEILKKASALSGKGAEPVTQASIAMTLGTSLSFRGKPEAIDFLRNAVEKFSKTEDKFLPMHMRAILSLGHTTLYLLQDYTKAKECFNSVLDPKFGMEGQVMGKLGLTALSFDEGNPAEGKKLMSELEALLPTVEIPMLKISILSSLAMVATDEGDFTPARAYLCATDPIAAAGPNNQQLLSARKHAEARIELFTRNYVKARELMLEAKDICEETLDYRAKIGCLRGLGEIAFLEDDYEMAKGYFLQIKEFTDRNHVNPDLLGSDKYKNFLTNAFTKKDIFLGWRTFLERENMPTREKDEGNGRNP